MEEKLKEIIAGYIGIPAEQIGPDTPIGRPAVRSSIMLHRMYARLAEEGLVVQDYTSIRVFADLSGEKANGQENGRQPVAFAPVPPQGAVNLGIDIEEIAALPRATDFRNEEFYKMNFTPAEMAYCILQSDAYSSFAGLFAAKEALVKADGSMRGRPFNHIEIGHSPDGKPEYPGFAISISHAGGVAVAAAVRTGQAATIETLKPPPPKAGSSWVSWLAILLSVAALAVVLLHL